MPLTPLEERKREMILEALDKRREQARRERASRRSFSPQPYQELPEGDWDLYILQGGRDAGKSQTLAWLLDEHVHGPPCDPRIPGGHRPVIAGPTLGDAIASLFKAPGGVQGINPDVVVVQKVGGTYMRWPGGTEGVVLGAYSSEDVERFRAAATNACGAWCDELASWRQLGPAMTNLELAVRVGPRPRIIAATTPKARRDYRELIKRKRTLVRRVSILENKHANPERVAAWVERYEGTRLGRQELYGELLQDVDGALWAWDTIEKARGAELPKIDGVIVESALAHLDKVVVAVDPAFSGKGDETGIVVAGAHGDRRAEVLADLSVRATPDGWGRAVVAAYRTFRADTVVVETNLGGPELVRGIVRQIDPAVHITDVRASRGKLLRAEPIAALYEQGRITHRGSFDELETQMTDWTSDSSESPDRLDALVYALTHLVVDASGPVTTSAKQTAGIRLAR